MKNFIQWNYQRGTWQYDVFCLLIVAFIFLTPKSWFEKKERLATQSARLNVKAEDFPPDAATRTARARELSGEENAGNVAWHESKNANGENTDSTDLR